MTRSNNKYALAGSIHAGGLGRLHRIVVHENAADEALVVAAPRTSFVPELIRSIEAL